MGQELDRLIVAIDELIDDELARGEQYGDIGQPVCELCGGDWHGGSADNESTSGYGRKPRCPGAFATDAQRERWLHPPAHRELRGCGKGFDDSPGELWDCFEPDGSLDDYAEGLRYLGCGAVLSADSCQFCGRVSQAVGGLSDCSLARVLDQQRSCARYQEQHRRSICHLPYLD
jgi:hypothetical protein